jgi:hypothetical protein
MAVTGVYFAEQVSSYDMFNVGKLFGLISFSLGGGWVAILGYILLKRIGWRYFIVCTSVPVFIPPICIIHCIMRKEEQAADDRVALNSDEESEVIEVSGFWARLIKGCVTDFINTFQGWGSILLIPALLSYLKKKQSHLTEDQELLILALLYGGAKLLGRILSIFLLRGIRFRILQPILSAMIAASYLTLILVDQSLVVTIVAMGIANMCFCVTRCELTLMEFDKYFFGTERLVLAIGVMAGTAMMGAAVGAVVAQFLSSSQAVIVTFVLSCVQVVAFCSITER